MEAVRPQITKRRKFIADGVMYSELNEYFLRSLAEHGYAGVEVRATAAKTEIIIKATKTDEVIGEKGRHLAELTSVIKKRFNIPNVELFAMKVMDLKGLSAQIQCESLKHKLLAKLPARRAAGGVLRAIMENGAKGAEVAISGKLSGQRAKTQKFSEGYMIKTGYAREEYITTAVRHIMMKTGILGIKVSIMLPHDPTGVKGVKIPLADSITILEPKEA